MRYSRAPAPPRSSAAARRSKSGARSPGPGFILSRDSRRGRTLRTTERILNGQSGQYRKVFDSHGVHRRLYLSRPFGSSGGTTLGARPGGLARRDKPPVRRAGRATCHRRVSRNLRRVREQGPQSNVVLQVIFFLFYKMANTAAGNTGPRISSRFIHRPRSTTGSDWTIARAGNGPRTGTGTRHDSIAARQPKSACHPNAISEYLYIFVI